MGLHEHAQTNVKPIMLLALPWQLYVHFGNGITSYSRHPPLTPSKCLSLISDKLFRPHSSPHRTHDYLIKGSPALHVYPLLVLVKPYVRQSPLSTILWSLNFHCQYASTVNMLGQTWLSKHHPKDCQPRDKHCIYPWVFCTGTTY